MTEVTPEEIQQTPIVELKALVDLLAELDVPPLHLHVDALRPTDHRADIRLWLRTRSEFEAVCKAMGAKPAEARYDQKGQRTFHAEVDTDTRKLLVSCVSMEHHTDWQSRGGAGDAVDR